MFYYHNKNVTIYQVKQALEEISERVPEPFNIAEIMAKVEERTPYIVVAFQECEQMNFLMAELKRSLKELSLGLKVSITPASPLPRETSLVFLHRLMINALNTYHNIFSCTFYITEFVS
jgi:dynein heavy chain